MTKVEEALEEQLRLVARNLEAGMSRSIQRLQARAIMEVLRDLEKARQELTSLKSMLY